MKLKDLDDQWLLTEFFFGIYKGDPSEGDVWLENPTDPTQRMPKSVLNNAIDAAIDRLEKTILARIRKVEFREESHDYDVDHFDQHVYIPLDHYPVFDIPTVEVRYGEQGGTIWEVPQDMIQLHTEKFGTIQLLPFRGVAVTSSYDPALVPFISGMFAASHVPSVLKVTYNAGMDGLDRELDHDLVRAIGLMASVQPFNILGDVLIGAGISTISTSFDGISQSINTTASAENSAFSARILAHREELYGKERYPGIVESLKTEWRRIPLNTM